MIIDGQNVFDVTMQNFGTLNNTIEFLVENNYTLNQNLIPGDDVVLNTTNKGDENVKKLITLDNLRLMNEAVIIGVWILANNVWDDQGQWIDTETWND
jgi:hypothetical protein